MSEKEPKKHAILSRIIAIICLLCILSLIVMFIYAAVTGSPYFTGITFLLIIVPVILYFMLWLRKVFDKTK